MGFYNSFSEFKGFNFCPVTGHKASYSFSSPNPMYEGFEYKLLDINPNVVIGLSSRYAGDDAAYEKLRKYSIQIVQMIKEADKPFFEIDSVLLNELEGSHR